MDFFSYCLNALIGPCQLPLCFFSVIEKKDPKIKLHHHANMRIMKTSTCILRNIDKLQNTTFVDVLHDYSSPLMLSLFLRKAILPRAHVKVTSPIHNHSYPSLLDLQFSIGGFTMHGEWWMFTKKQMGYFDRHEIENRSKSEHISISCEWKQDARGLVCVG